MSKQSKHNSAIVLLADGFEEVEAVTSIDFLRRAEIAVTTVAIGSERSVRGSHGIALDADTILAELDPMVEVDALVLPGGMPGAANLSASSAVTALLARMIDSGRIVAAICAAPAVVLGTHGYLKGRRFTCYPGYEDRVADGNFVAEQVVEDGTLITSRGPGTAAAFAIAIIHRLVGDTVADRISRQTVQ